MKLFLRQMSLVTTIIMIITCILPSSIIGLITARAEMPTPILYEVPVGAETMTTNKDEANLKNVFDNRTTGSIWDAGKAGYFIVDFGVPTLVTNYDVVTKTGNNSIMNATLQVSDNGVDNWEVVDTIDNDPVDAALLRNMTVDTPKNARYYKFDITKDGGWNAQIFEIKFYSTENSNIALYKNIMDVSVNYTYTNMNERPSNILDGNEYSLWSANGGSPTNNANHYMVIDLGGFYNVKRWFLGNYGWKPSNTSVTPTIAYDIQYLKYNSDGTETWINGVSKDYTLEGSNNCNSGICDFTARYVKLDVTKPRATGTGLNISEFQLFGEKVPGLNAQMASQMLVCNDPTQFEWDASPATGSSCTGTLAINTLDKKTEFTYTVNNQSAGYVSYRFKLPDAWNFYGTQSVKLSMLRDSTTSYTPGTNDSREARIVLEERDGNTLHDEFTSSIILKNGSGEDSYQLPLSSFTMLNKNSGDGKLDTAKVKYVKIQMLSNVKDNTTSNVHALTRFSIQKGYPMEVYAPITYELKEGPEDSETYCDITKAEILPSGDIRIRGQMKNLSVSDEKYSMIAAVYHKDTKKLVDVQVVNSLPVPYRETSAFMTEVTVPEDTETEIAEPEGAEDEGTEADTGNYELKCYIWSDNMVPITKINTLPYDAESLTEDPQLTPEPETPINPTPPYEEIEEESDDFDTMRLAWKNYLIGGLDYYDPEDPDLKGKLDTVTTDATNLLSTMNKTEDRTYLWSDYKYVPGTTTPTKTIGNPDAITGSYGNLEKMALAYRSPTSPFYLDEALEAAILDGFDWLYENWYNEEEILAGDTSPMGNWWEWEIGTPLAIVNIMTLMYPVLSEEQIDDYDAVLNKFCPDPKYRELQWLGGSYHGAEEEGANLVWKCSYTILQGILTKKETRLLQGRQSVEPVFTFVDKGDGSSGTDGFYTDGTFIQHGKTPYNGGYGVSLLDHAGNILTMLAGVTEYDLSQTNKQTIYDWVINSYEPIVYRGAVMDMFRGRGLGSGDDRTTGNDIARCILKLSKYAPEEYSKRFKSMVKYWIDDTRDNQGRLIRDFYNDTGASLSTLTNAIAFKQLVNDKTIPSRGAVSYNKQFSDGDRVVHSTDKFGFGISMSSDRINRFSSINDENISGWYTGAGMTTLYNDDHRSFQAPYWATQDKERLPGTTSERRALAGASHGEQEGANTTGGSDWTGGASIADKYGVAGMEWVEFGGSTSIKKSWFMFDKEVVALGSDLKTTIDNPYKINTTIDNRVTTWQYDVFMNTTVSAETKQGLLETGTDHADYIEGSHADTKWVYSANGNGFYFPKPVTLKWERENREGDYKSINKYSSMGKHKQSYVTMFIDHEVNPNIEDSAYEYVILPAVGSKANMKAYADSPEVSILSNTSKVQAVYKNILNIFAANFFENNVNTVSEVTALGNVTSDKKASVITQITGTTFDVGVSDPTHNNIGKTTITFSGVNNAALISKDERITIKNLSPLTLEIDMNESRGKTINAKFTLQ